MDNVRLSADEKGIRVLSKSGLFGRRRISRCMEIRSGWNRSY